MNVKWHGESGSDVKYGSVIWNSKKLAGYKWPIIEVRGRMDGPKFCVMAGVHPNESSSIRAAIELKEHIDTKKLRGYVSIMPIVNCLSNFKAAVECPVDGLNIHWQFPGAPSGTFSEVLAHSLISEWAFDSIGLVDMHGGDFGENLERYVVIQETTSAKTNGAMTKFASCFDTKYVVVNGCEWLRKRGRCSTALAAMGVPAVTSEAGREGAYSREDKLWHINGVCNILRRIGMLEDRIAEVNVDQTMQIGTYHWLISPDDGALRYVVEPGDHVMEGQTLVSLRDLTWCERSALHAPADGVLLWRSSRCFASKGESIGAVGCWKSA